MGHPREKIMVHSALPPTLRKEREGWGSHGVGVLGPHFLQSSENPRALVGRGIPPLRLRSGQAL